MTARGIRNNNPLNIRRTKSRWLGMKAEVRDTAFCEFTSLAYGFRAAFVLLRQYYVKYQLVTIDQIIHRWAPPSENYTAVYVKNVCKITGLSPDELLPHPSKSKEVWCSIVFAMAYVECAKKFDISIIRQAWEMAQLR